MENICKRAETMPRRLNVGIIKLLIIVFVAGYCAYHIHTMVRKPRTIITKEVRHERKQLSLQEIILLENLKAKIEKERLLREKKELQRLRLKYKQEMMKRKYKKQSNNKQQSGLPKDMKIQNPILPKQEQVLRQKQKINPALNVVPSLPPKNSTLKSGKCLPLPQFPRVVTVCVHDTNKDEVSNAIMAGRLWQKDYVLQMDAILQSYPEMGLVDIGANVGVYTLAAASKYRFVLAVDILDTNILLLQKSVYMGGYSPQVTIVKNAIYEDHSKLNYMTLDNNTGMAVIVDENQSHDSIQAVCLDDLIPLVRASNVFLRIAMSSNEHKAIQCGYRFFKEITVPIVQIYWRPVSKEAAESIANFMDSFFYTAKIFNGTGYVKWEVNYSNWTGIVFFVHDGW